MVKKILVALVVLAGLLVPVLGLVEPVNAANSWTSDACSKVTDAGQREALGCNDGGTSAPDAVLNILRVVIGIVGLLTVVMIIVAGQRYMTAAGDPGKLQQAKTMLAFSIVGLIVAVLAFAIVNFVIATV